MSQNTVVVAMLISEATNLMYELNYLTIDVIKHHGQKQLMEERANLSVQFIAHHTGKSGQEPGNRR